MTRGTFIKHERYSLQTNEANFLPLNAGIRFTPLCIPPVNTVGYNLAVPWKALETLTTGRRGIWISVEASMAKALDWEVRECRFESRSEQ